VPGITFEATQQYDFKQVFALLPDRAWALEWRPSRDFEIVHVPREDAIDVASLVYRCADDGVSLPSETLRLLVETNPQVIDGELVGFVPGAHEPDMLLRSVRGDEWDIETRDAEELASIARQIPVAQPHPQPKL
jgi:hypothetical protein